MFGRSVGWLLNQNGWLAKSLTPAIGVDGSGAASAGAGPPCGAKVTEWKPLILQRTRSPRWIVIVRRKYSFASPKACWNFGPCRERPGLDRLRCRARGRGHGESRDRHQRTGDPCVHSPLLED